MGEQSRQLIETAVGEQVLAISPLSGGCIGQVYHVQLGNEREIVAKVDASVRAALKIEGFMLRYLAEHSRLPVPKVIHNSNQLLLMECLRGESRFNRSAEEHAAELLADLHTATAPTFGMERDTLIGGLRQPNAQTTSWLEFFRDQRLLYMADLGAANGRLSPSLRRRLGNFCGHLETWIAEPERPSLLHGDVWTTNVLAWNGRVTGFIDPAIYYGHPEIELAFTTLFGTFGEPFFQRYREISPIAPGFFEERRDIYNLYPLLVHVLLFGGGYAASVDQILRRFGY